MKTFKHLFTSGAVAVLAALLMIQAPVVAGATTTDGLEDLIGGHVSLPQQGEDSSGREAARKNGPTVTQGSTFFYGVDAIRQNGRTFGWAVGDRQAPAGNRGAVVSFVDGARLATPAFDPGAESGLSSVTALAARKAVAVGWQWPGDLLPLVARYNNGAWQAENVPNLPGAYLAGVDSAAGGHIVAVGAGTDGPLVLQTTGDGWTQLATPSIANATLSGVEIIAANDIWTVGAVYADGWKPFAMHFDGHGWTVAQMPEFGAVRSMLSSVAVGPGGAVWASGYINPTGAWDADMPLFGQLDTDGFTQLTKAGARQGAAAYWALDAAGKGSGQLWMAGSTTGGGFVQRFNGEDYSLKANALKMGDEGYALNGIAAVRPADIYVVGGGLEGYGTSDAHWQDVLSHFNGTRWVRI